MSAREKTIVALDGTRVFHAFGVLSVIEREPSGLYCACRPVPERVAEATFDMLVADRRITPLTPAVTTMIEDPVAIYFDSTGIFHRSNTIAPSLADKLWKLFFDEWWTTAAVEVVSSERLPGKSPALGLQTDRVALLPQPRIADLCAKLVARALERLDKWDRSRHGALQPNATWRLLQWLEFASAYAKSRSLEGQLAAWLLAVARTGRVEHVTVERVEDVMEIDFSHGELTRIRDRAAEIHSRYFAPPSSALRAA